MSERSWARLQHPLLCPAVLSAVPVGACAVLGWWVVRHECTGTHSGLTVLLLGEDDEDAPMITGFSDDVPMVIA